MPISTPLMKRLGIRYPIILGAMDLVADARLTRTVSKEGGFGILGAGYGDHAWLERELSILEGFQQSEGLKYGVGFITWSLAQQPRLLDRALAAKPKLVWLSFGDPAPFVDKIKASGALVLCQIQTVAMATDAVNKGADIVVAQGSEAGGHGISRGTISLVPAVADAVGHKASVAAAGGIADGRGLAAALLLGAESVVLGTRFYASDESAGFPEAKRRIAAASGEDTVRSIVFDVSKQKVWPAPYTARCLLNDHARKWVGREIELLRNADEEAPAYANARATGNFDVAAIIAGEASGLIHQVLPAGAIMRQMSEEAERIMEGMSRKMLSNAA
ncbi:MAG TPA: nitronate monooxygenase [Xanthobacteraceae bacterium]|nr:nitronate monooxygenase [Xanthobacteraceae bacterium]